MYRNIILFFLLTVFLIGCNKVDNESSIPEIEEYEQVSLSSLSVGQKSKFKFEANSANNLFDTIVFEIIEQTDSGFISIDYLSKYSKSVIEEPNNNLPYYLSQNDTAYSLINFDNNILSISKIDNQSRLIMPFGSPNLSGIDSLSFSADGCGETILRADSTNLSNLSNSSLYGKLNEQIINEISYENAFLFYHTFTGPGPGTQRAKYYIITNDEGNIIRSYFSSLGFGSLEIQCFSLIPN